MLVGEVIILTPVVSGFDSFANYTKTQHSFFFFLHVFSSKMCLTEKPEINQTKHLAVLENWTQNYYVLTSELINNVQEFLCNNNNEHILALTLSFTH